MVSLGTIALVANFAASAALDIVRSFLEDQSNKLNPIDFIDFLGSITKNVGFIAVHPRSERDKSIFGLAFLQNLQVSVNKNILPVKGIEIPQRMLYYTGSYVGTLFASRIVTVPVGFDETDYSLEYLFADTLGTDKIYYSEITILMNEDYSEAEAAKDAMEEIQQSLDNPLGAMIDRAIDRIKQNIVNMVPVLGLLFSDGPGGISPDIKTVRVFSGIPESFSLSASTGQPLILENFSMILNHVHLPTEPP